MFQPLYCSIILYDDWISEVAERSADVAVHLGRYPEIFPDEKANESFSWHEVNDTLLQKNVRFSRELCTFFVVEPMSRSSRLAGNVKLHVYDVVAVV